MSIGKIIVRRTHSCVQYSRFNRAGLNVSTSTDSTEVHVMMSSAIGLFHQSVPFFLRDLAVESVPGRLLQTTSHVCTVTDSQRIMP